MISETGGATAAVVNGIGRGADLPAGARRVEGHGRHVVGSTPYPWPYDGDLSTGRLALIVAGAQVAFADRSQRAAEVGATLGRLAETFRSHGAAVVLVRHHVAVRRPVTLPPISGAPGWEVAMPVAPGDIVVDAGGIDGFVDSGLDTLLRRGGVDHLCLAGYGGELAVDSTLRSANDRGYECLVVSDAVAPIDVRTGASALASVTMSGGIFGAVGTAEALLVALTRQGVT